MDNVETICENENDKLISVRKSDIYLPLAIGVVNYVRRNNPGMTPESSYTLEDKKRTNRNLFIVGGWQIAYTAAQFLLLANYFPN
jgi:hypothetical protein